MSNRYNEHRLRQAKKHYHPIRLYVDDFRADNASPIIDEKVYPDAYVSIKHSHSNRTYYFDFTDLPDKYEQAKNIAQRLNRALQQAVIDMGGIIEYSPCKECDE